MKEKIWYLVVGGKKEGPYSKGELRDHPLFNPDALVWREGFPKPLPARAVKELEELFKDDVTAPEDEAPSFRPDDEAVMRLESQTPSPLFWLLILLIISAYAFYLFIK